MNLIVIWLAGLMTWLVPPSITEKAVGPNHETAAERTERYYKIASAVAAVAYDKDEAPLFQGPYGRAQTATAILGVYYHESGFHKSVHNGTSRGDHGRSACLGQHNIGSGKTLEGWTAEDLINSDELCARATLHTMRRSFTSCRYDDPDDRLYAYASGSCPAKAEEPAVEPTGDVVLASIKSVEPKHDKGDAHRKSAIRMATGRRLMAHSRPPVSDSSAMRELVSMR